MPRPGLRNLARFEALEPRLLLSADLIHATSQGVALDATLKVVDADGAAMVRLIDNQSSAVLAEHAFDQDIDVSVRGNDQSDKLKIDFDRASIAHQIRFNFDGGDGGVDELIGSDRSNTWRLDAPGAGTLDEGTFTDVERITGGAADDTFVVLDASGTIAVEGGEGNNTLVGVDADNAWQITGTNAGTLNGEVYADIQNLTGGVGQDSFTFAPSGQLSGTISGGGGSDTLVAADDDNTWVIAGADAGSLNGQAFVGIENLRGGALRDNFVFAGGSISGTIDGGAGVNTFDYSSRSSGVAVDFKAGYATDAGAMANINNVVGGAGDDTLVGRNDDHTWTVSGNDAGSVGEVAFAAIENITGGDGSDTFVFTANGDLSGIVTGGLGDDFLAGADQANTWRVTNLNAGSMNDIAFSGIENLLGGSGSDVFVLMAAAGLSGTIAGGQGVDRVRGPERKTVWRFTGHASGSAGGTRFTGAEAVEGGADDDTFTFDDGADFGGNVDGGAGDDDFILDQDSVQSIAGGAGNDTLFGPSENAVWRITGVDAGTVGAVAFSGVENLVGAADYDDAFLFHAGGNVGRIDGGAGGNDSLALVDGVFDLVTFTVIDSETGSVDRDGSLFVFTGLEPAVDPTPGNKLVEQPLATADDSISIEGLLGGITVSSPTFPESFVFTNPNDVTVKAGAGNDRITIGVLDTYSHQLSVFGEGGDDTVIITPAAFGLPPVLDGGSGAGTDTLRIDTPRSDLTLGFSVGKVGTAEFTHTGFERAILEGRTLTPSLLPFAGPVIFTSALPDWESEGPGPVTGSGQPVGIPNFPVVGAITSVAVVNASTIYVGAAGGIWKTVNADTASAAGPTWTNLTDQLPSQNITALAVDRANTNIIYAGTGTGSNSGLAGQATGLLKTTNGGATWSVIPSAFASHGRTINAIVANGNRVLVASDATNFGPADGKPGHDDNKLGGGLLLSTDGGSTFRKISGNSNDTLDNDIPKDGLIDALDLDGSENTGLPGGTVTDLKADPGNPNLLYAAIRDKGLFVSSDGGETWQGGFNGASAFFASSIKLSVSGGLTPNGNHPVYAGFVVPTIDFLSLASGATTLTVPATALFEAGDSIKIVRAADNKEEFAVIRDIQPALGGNSVLNLTAPLALAGGFAAGDRVTKTGNADRLENIYRSDDNGQNWVGIGRPTSTDTYWFDANKNGVVNAGEAIPNQVFGIHSGGQGASNISLLADYTNPNLVYVGGDRQPVVAGRDLDADGDTIDPGERFNSVSLTQWASRLFRGSYTAPGSTNWQQIVGNPAGGTAAKPEGTAPHADSRGMVFAADKSLLEFDDGGLYRLTNPSVVGPADKLEKWTSLIGNLAITEFYTVAWNTDTNTIIAGAQDNGTLRQNSFDDKAWTDVSGGDGGTVSVGVGTGANDDREYYSSQNFGNFTIKIPSTGARFKPTLNVFASGALNAAAIGGLSSVDATFGARAFLSRHVVNAVDPTRMLLATGHVYESIVPNPNPAGLVTGDALVPLAVKAGGTLKPATVVSGANTVLNPATDLGEVRAMIYGGFQGATPMADIAYVGTASQLFVRQATPFGSLTAVSSWKTATSAGVRDIAVDPTDWRKVYVLDDKGRIWFSSKGDASPTSNWGWTDISGKVKALPGAQTLQSIAVANPNGTAVVLAGGSGGVYRKIGTDGWSELGAGLPNELVTDLDVVTGTDNILIASTLGRGAWAMRFLSQTIDQQQRLQITGSDGVDNIRLVRNAAHPWMLDVFQWTGAGAEPATPASSVPLASLYSISIDAGGGDDSITIDSSNGPIAVPGKIAVNGGGQSGLGDSVIFKTAPANSSLAPTSVIKDLATPAGSVDSYSKDRWGQAGNQAVTWSNAEFAGSPGAVQNQKNAAFRDGLKAFGKSLLGLSDTVSTHPLAGTKPQSLLFGLQGQPGAGREPISDPTSEFTEEGSPGLLQEDATTSIFSRLFEEALNGFNIDDIDPDGLINDPLALKAALEGMGATVVFHDFDSDSDPATRGVQFEVTLLNRHLTGTVDLDVDAAVAGGLGTVQLTGAIEIGADVDLSLVFGVDDGGFYLLPSASGTPMLKIHALMVDGEARGQGRLGFLGVDMDQASISVDDQVSIEFVLLDADADGYIRVPDLAPDNLSGLFSADVKGDAADGLDDDLVLTGKFGVSAILPGVDSGIHLIDADVTLAWTNLADPTSVHVSAASSDGQRFLDFLKVSAQDIVDQLATFKAQIDSVFGTEVPYMSDSLTELVGFVTTFQEKVLDPITGGIGGTASVPTIQDLITTLGNSLGVSLDQLGLAYDSTSKELTFHLVLDKTLLNETRSLGAGADLLDGLADVQFSTEATVDAKATLDTILGVDIAALVAGGDPRDWFFLKNPRVTADVTLTATDVEASARFGFLSIGVDEGTLSTGTDPISVTVTLNDTGSNDGGTPNGRIDLRELLDGLGTLDELVSVSGSGSVEMFLPVEAAFLGLPEVVAPVASGYANAITVSLPDFSNPSSAVVTFGSGLTELKNFKNIDAASMVGVLGQLTFWLDEFRRSDVFANLDLPLVGPALDEALQLADAFRDLALIDDNDNQLDDQKTLLSDLNAALEDAGLGRKLFAANVGGKIALVALDASITSFTVAGATALGFTASQGGSVPGGKFFAEAVATTAFGDAEGNLGTDLNFTVAIGTKTYTVELAQSATTANTKIGDDRWKLVNANNSPTFATAQQMTLRVLDAFGAGYPGLTYDPLTDSLNFTLDLSQVFANLNLPFSFDIANLPDFLKLQTSGALALKVSGGLNLDVGVFLGNAEPGDKLQAGTLLADLSQPVVLNDNQRYDAQPVVGKLTGDAHFSIAVDGAAAVPVIVTKLAAGNNTTVADLVSDINAALTTAGLNTQVLAQAVPATGGQPAPQQIQFVGLTVATSLAVTAAAGDPALTDIGLPASKTLSGVNPTLIAAKTLPPLKGRLTADAGFTVELTKNGTPTDSVVALTPAQTQDNDYPFSIVNDIQAKLDESRVKVSFSNGALTFSTLDGSSILVKNVTGTAGNELGIAGGSGSSDDLLITLRNGATYRIAFDSNDTTVQHIIDAIETATTVAGTPRVTVQINEAGSGLTLTDHTTGGATFKIQILNNSPAGLLLGIVRQDSSGAEGDTSDGIIEGADIAALTALDRFFVKATPEGSDPLAGLKVEIGTPLPLTASAKFGFVDLGLQGQGGLTGPAVTSANNALQAQLSVRLLEPAGSTDGRVSLAEMIGSLNDLGSLFTFSLTGSGQLDLSLTPATIASLSGLGIDVGSGPKIEIAADMAQNVFDGHAPVLSVTTQGFDELDGFGNLDFNFQSIVAGLSALVDFLDDFEALGFLNDPIPVIDVSVKDLVGIAQQFADAVTAAQNDPAGSLQVLEDKLLAAFGLPAGSPQLNLLLVDGPTGNKVLKIDTQLTTSFSKSLSINLDLGLDPLEFGGDADLLAEGSLRLDLDFGFDIENPLNIYIFNTTGIAATLDLNATGLDFKAAVGPLGVFVTDGAASIHGTLAPTLSDTVLSAGFQGAFAGTGGMAAIGDIDLGNDLSVNVGGALDVSLPVYFPTESVKAGTVKLVGTLGYSGGALTANLTPSAVGPDGTTPIGLGDLFTFDPGNLSLLDQLLLGVDGVDLFLEGLQDLLDGTLGGFELPLVGDKLSGASAAIGDFRDGFVEGFRKAMEDLANPALAFAEAGITAGSAAASVPQGADPVSKLLLQLLGPTGLGVIDSAADIVFDTNIQIENDPSKVFFDWGIHMGGVLADAGAGIGFNLGIPGLGLETQGDIHLDVDWALDLGFGINFEDGFYLDIADQSELELTARVTTPGLGITGRLGFLQIEGHENVEADEGAGAETERGATGLAVQFGIDILNRQNAADARLGFAELGRIGIDAKIAGKALVDLQMALKLNSDLVSNPGNFPSIVADFAFDWGLGTVDNPATAKDEFDGVSLSNLDGSFLKNGLNFIGFDDIGLDLGQYFSDVIGPIVEKVQEVTAPIKPFLDFLTEPIPVISALAGPTSLLDIAAMSGAVNPGIIKAIEIVDQVVDIVSDLDTAGGTTILYVDDLLPGGGLTIYQAPASGLAAAGAGAGIPNFDPSKPINLSNLKGFVDTLPDELGFLGDALGAATDVFSKAVSKMRPGGGVDAGFKLPIVEDPSQIFGMLLGQPADLVTFTMAPLEVEAEFSAFFSIFGPLGVSINAEFSAMFGPFTFGYDTYGITQFAASDFRNPLLLLDGLYVGDLDAQGKDIPELQFDAGLWAAAELNLGIARGGVGGGLFAEIDFNLYDPDHDGKVRVKELITTIANEFKYGTPALSPLAIFDISGKLTAELFAFVKIDFGFFTVDEKFLITDPIELLSFENVFERFPTLATELDDGVLQLNIGKNAAARIEGNLADVGETMYVKQGSDANHVKVWAPQFGIDESEAQEYGASNLIVAFGGEGDDTIDFSAVTSAVKLEIYGDAGDDVIIGTSGNGAAFLVGDSGDDELTGGGGGDTLFGGTGLDKLWGGAGNDWLFGDGDDAGYLVGSVVTAGVKGSDANDELYGQGGDDLLFGSGGTDKLEGGDNNDVLIGDGGQVTVLGDRRVATTRELDSDASTNDMLRLELAVRDTSKNGKGALDNLFGGAGNDHLYGGFGNDFLYGEGGDDVIYGELGSDTADAGAGDDVVFGDFGVFTEVTVGIETTLEPFVTVGGEKDDLSGGSGNDKLLGGAGNDKLQGNDGNDTLWGGVGRDKIWGDTEGGGGSGNDKLYGEADSDELRAGAGDDYLEGGGGNDIALGGAGADTLVGGYGSDTLDGEADSDTYRISVRGGPTTQLTTAYDSGAPGVDSLVIVGTPGDDTLLLRAMADSYFPTLSKLQNLITRYFNSTIADRLAAMVQAFSDAYGPWDAGHGLIQALTGEYQLGLAAQLKAAAAANASADPDAPAPGEIDDLIDEVLASNAASKLDALQKAISAAFVEADVDVPNTLFSALTAAYKRTDAGALDAIKAAVAPYYVAESLYPRSEGLQLIVDEVYADAGVQADARLDEILERVGNAFATAFVTQRSAMLDALQAAWDALPDGSSESDEKTDLKDAIDTTYTADPVDPDTFTNTAFVAVINEGGTEVERFNYRRMEGLVVNTLGGEDYVVLDDLLAAATINLGDGNDRVQVGQVFRSERVKDPEGALITGITAEDVFSTVEITRGWLSNGVSVATTINGGDGDDNFTVFRNVAVLNLNGGDGDDVFTVRAFALKGSSDNERARTDMKGDGGADTILYVVNAPVGIDGGDGFDTVRIVGTEFGDDFVVTDSGVFGAGLNVSYVNVERLVADGAEGDDRFFVQSTGLDVVTEIDGGLGSDTFFVGGNPSRAPVAVVSNDLRGHSGILLHSVQAGSDPAWAGLAIEGLSANVGDNEDTMILLAESGGSSMVIEGAAPLAFGAADTYRLRLSRAPESGKKVVLAVVPAGLSPEEQARNFADIQVWDPTLNGGLGDWADSRTIALDGSNWSTGVEVTFRAKEDVGYEGRRFTFINHKVTEETTDVSFLEAQVRSLKVQMEDNDRDGVIVVASALGNTVLEAGFTDNFSVKLSQAPTADVIVSMSLAGAPGQVVLSSYQLTFSSLNWNTPQTVTVTAKDDSVIEGFHTEFIRFDVSSADHDQIKGPFAAGDVVKVGGTDVTVISAGKAWLQVDGDIDAPGVQEITPAKPSTYVLLPHRPVTGTVAVRVAGGELASERFSVSGNTITFLSASGAPELRTGKVEVNYQYKEAGYDQTEVRDQYVDIYDNDAPAVIIRPANDGMVDVVEGDPSSSDTYTVRLSSKPADDVVIVIDSVKTRTTWGANAYFENQLLLSDSDETDVQSIKLTFTSLNWNIDQTVTVRAYDDTQLDGNDTQVFAPDLQTVNKIRGPLIIEGAAGAGSLSLPTPLMMPWELNIRPSDGNVLAFAAADAPAGAEYMTVERSDLQAVVNRFKEDDPTFILAKLAGKTLEMSKGAGTDVVLDPQRPDDKFDRFWLITHVEQNYGGDSAKVRLTLQNPTAVDPTRANVIAPDTSSEYAITSLSVNFFADEREQVDYLFVYDNDSVADDQGALTSADGAVLGFDASITQMTVQTSALQRAASLLGLAGPGELAGRKLEITVGPGTGRMYQIVSVSAADGDTKVLTLTALSGSGTPTNRSEFRVEGSDRYGRITGFGMGPNVLFAGLPQGGGITYGDIEVTQVELGLGNDTVRVDYATNAEDHSTVRTGDFYTQTILITGGGNDTVTVRLSNGDSDASGDGAFALDTGAGNDKVFGAASTRSLVVFGGEGDDEIHTGNGNDIVFGDIGRVDYTKKIDVGGIQYDSVVTRLGSSVPQNPVNPHVTFATNNTITDTATLFPTDYEGLVGLSVQVISPEGHVQFRTVIANTAHTITVDANWVEFPVYNAADPNDNYYYRVSSYPDDQTDGLLRGPRVIWSVKDSLGGKDKLFTGDGDDVAVGGIGNDEINMGAGIDRAAGDDARLDFVPVGSGSTQTRLAKISDPGSSGDDTLWGDDGNDVLIGGLGNDKLYGQSNADVLVGDTATIDFGANGLITRIVTPAGQGGSDEIYGGDGRDIAIGGALGDHVEGGNDVDMLIGDAAIINFDSAGTMVQVDAATAPAQGGADEMRGDGGDDVLIGGAKDDRLDGGAQDDLIVGDNAVLLLNPASGNAVKPRFRTISGAIYDANGNAQVGSSGQARPGGMPAWADWTITLDPSLSAANFGNDYIAGGANDDTIFGQLGDDVIQGDGSIDLAGGASRTRPSVEGTNDGDDYIEGNGGNDVIFGNLGQDDLIGGSSSLFSLNSAALRPDGGDVIFGGAGTDTSRNNLGDAVLNGAGNAVVTLDNGHSRDADVILGDNGNIYRLVGTSVNSGAYLTFNYDQNSPFENRGTLRIIPRATELLDYTPGGTDYTPAPETDSIAINPVTLVRDIGGDDELHGESGDDFIYGQLGADVLYGDGQDDDIIGGYGNDWISGGTGDDGVIGDDGRILTSRNGQIEVLNGLTIAVTPSTVATGGNMQTADINVAGQLKKSVDLTPFSSDPGWNPATDEFGGLTRKHNDDIIFGGLGNDWLHGGSGDDAISGAEALPVSYAPTYDANGNANGRVETDFYHPYNPGNALAFNPIDVRTAHANRARAGEFALYDEYDPLRKILLNTDGTASKWTGATPTGAEFFLNFLTGDTNAPDSSLDRTKKTDGDDKIFGDLGNDWLVGGSGRDDLYGGFGNDLLNVDDDLASAGGLNNTPDTSASYEDRAFGGAGRDVLIANTGGDRLIDWSGEYNSYLVPFSPFGMATVSRSIQPALQDFLYALSASDGADPTRAADVIALGQSAEAARNGEPWGELGLVLQKDAAWGDQHGGPSDPQPGNSKGARDVLRTANFNTGAAQGFTPQIGTFSVVNNRYQVAPSTAGGDAISLFNMSDTVIPTYFEMQATINAVKPLAGNKANAFLIFDWQSNTDFKFAGIDVSTNKIEIGHRSASGWVIDNWTTAQLKAGNDYVVMLSVNGNAATLTLGTTSVSYMFAQRIDSKGVKHGPNEGVAGIGAMAGTSAQIDDVVVQAPPGTITLDKTVDFGAISPASGLFNSTTAATGTWTTTTDGRFVGTTASTTTPAINLIGYNITPGAMIDVNTTLKTAGQGGVVFDYQGPTYYKFVTLSADSKQILIGHRIGATTTIDKTYSLAVSPTTDYAIEVKVRGGLVNVSLNGAVVVSNLFNETATMGGYGLISMKGATSGQTSFDVVRLRTDEAAFAARPAMVAAAADTMQSLTGATITLSSADLAGAIAQARQSWSGTGLSAAQLMTLNGISFELADLDGQTLGEEVGNTILIDVDAAGHGWFVDSSPADSVEFSLHIDPNTVAAAAGSVAYGKMDLVTVVSHEIGHVLGFDHSDAGRYAVMHEDLDPGVRYVLDAIASQQGASLPSDDKLLQLFASAQNRLSAFDKVTTPSATNRAFDLDLPANTGGVRGSIDWNDSFRGSWGTNPSPFGARLAKPASNFTDFLASSNDAGENSDDAKFDKMGSALNAGKYAKVGKTVGR